MAGHKPSIMAFNFFLTAKLDAMHNFAPVITLKMGILCYFVQNNTYFCLDFLINRLT